MLILLHAMEFPQVTAWYQSCKIPIMVGFSKDPSESQKETLP